MAVASSEPPGVAEFSAPGGARASRRRGLFSLSPAAPTPRDSCPLPTLPEPSRWRREAAVRPQTGTVETRLLTGVSILGAPQQDCGPWPHPHSSWDWTPAPPSSRWGTSPQSDRRGHTWCLPPSSGPAHPGSSHVPVSEKTWGPPCLEQEQGGPAHFLRPPPGPLTAGRAPQTPSPPHLHPEARMGGKPATPLAGVPAPCVRA